MNLSNSKVIIFDFDGTIANTLEIIAESYNKIAPFYNCKILNFEEKERFRSLRPMEFFKECNISPLLIPVFSLHIKAELFGKINDVKIFSGIAEAIFQLKSKNYVLGLMSSNSKKNIYAFLKTNQIYQYFDFVHSGKNIFGKDQVVSNLIRKYSIIKQNLIYVGDEVRDVEAMKKIHVKVVAVTWGFNSRDILELHSPDAIAEDPLSLPLLIEKL